MHQLKSHKGMKAYCFKLTDPESTRIELEFNILDTPYFCLKTESLTDIREQVCKKNYWSWDADWIACDNDTSSFPMPRVDSLGFGSDKKNLEEALSDYEPVVGYYYCCVPIDSIENKIIEDKFSILNIFDSLTPGDYIVYNTIGAEKNSLTMLYGGKGDFIALYSEAFRKVASPSADPLKSGFIGSLDLVPGDWLIMLSSLDLKTRRRASLQEIMIMNREIERVGYRLSRNSKTIKIVKDEQPERNFKSQ